MKIPGNSFWQKFMFILALGTTLSPIDAIPDIIPLLGQTDDLAAIGLLIFMGVRLLWNRYQERMDSPEAGRAWFGGPRNGQFRNQENPQDYYQKN